MRIKNVLVWIERFSIFGMLGWLDIKQRYRRSALGPLWITISMLIQIIVIGVVFGSLFNIELGNYFPYVALGIIFWSYISSTLNESCFSFIGVEHLIKQLPLPYGAHVLRVVWRNTIILFHNLLIIPFVWLYFGKEFSIQNLWVIFSLLLLIANLTWLGILIGMICTRFRDVAQIIASLLLVAFNLTPVMWLPKSLPAIYKTYLIDFNPLYYFLDLVRSPMLNDELNRLSVEVSIVTSIFGWIITMLVFQKFKKNIPYWL